MDAETFKVKQVVKLLQDAGHLNEFNEITAMCTNKNVLGNQLPNVGICPEQAPPNWFYSIQEIPNMTAVQFFKKGRKPNSYFTRSIILRDKDKPTKKKEKFDTGKKVKLY